MPLDTSDSRSLRMHHLVRRALRERAAYWIERYNERGPWTGAYSDFDYDTFPRYQIAFAILEDVEGLDPDELPSLEELRELLISSVELTEAASLEKTDSPIALAAVAEERAGLVAYLRQLDNSALASAEPLPYRRVLSTSEIGPLVARLKETWDADLGYWFPLNNVARSDVVAFHAPAFEENLGGRKLQELLATFAVSQIWELREYGASYRLDLSEFEPHYNGAEGFWFSDSLDWLIYASHESSVAVAGTALLAAVKNAWPEWADSQWHVEAA